MASGRGVIVALGEGSGEWHDRPGRREVHCKRGGEDYELKKLQIIEPNKRKCNNCDFLNFIIHVTGGHSDYSPRALKMVDTSLDNSRIETVRELEEHVAGLHGCLL